MSPRVFGGAPGSHPSIQKTKLIYPWTFLKMVMVWSYSSQDLTGSLYFLGSGFARKRQTLFKKKKQNTENQNWGGTLW